MYRYALSPRPHVLTPTDITTINYILEWPHLENPSNTTFAGLAQIDLCRCPPSNPPSPNRTLEEEEHQSSLATRYSSDIDCESPSHIYTRYRCLAPEVRFKSPTEQLWVLDAPHGPINMLRPATLAERELRHELHENAEPAAYVGKNILLLTGPCPRGRYQAYATLQYLRSLKPEARRNLEHISLLIQPFEEDCAEESCKQAYSELAEYILQNLPGFKTLHLNVWDDEQSIRSAAGEFSILLHSASIEIAVGWNWCKGEAKHYTSARAFLEAMSMKNNRPRDRGFKHRSLEEGLVMKENKQEPDGKMNEASATSIQEEDENADINLKDDEAHETGDSKEMKTNRREEGGNLDETTSSKDLEQDAAQPNHHNDSDKNQQEAQEPSREGENNTDDDWIDATLSPISHCDPEEGSWQVL